MTGPRSEIKKSALENMPLQETKVSDHLTQCKAFKSIECYFRIFIHENFYFCISLKNI